MTQTNVLSSFNDLNFDGYPDAAAVSGHRLLHDDARPGVIQGRPVGLRARDGGQSAVPELGCRQPDPGSYDNNTIKEDIYSAYVQAKFDGEIGGLETQTVVGLRYEQTKVEADAQQNVVDHFVWLSDNDFRPVFGTDLMALHDDADYSNWLPNIDFSVALNDTMKVRASVSQTIARPAVQQPVHDDEGRCRRRRRCWVVSRGLPGVTPASSRSSRPTSICHSSGTTARAATRRSASSGRRSTTSSVPESRPRTLFDLQDPTSGAPGTLTGDAAAALVAGGFAVNEQNLFTMAAVLNNPADFPNGADDYIDPTDDVRRC